MCISVYMAYLSTVLKTKIVDESEFGQQIYDLYTKNLGEKKYFRMFLTQE